MVDIHTHILYGVDDGSDSKETSKFLLDQAKENNITKILLTPHQNEETNNTEELKTKFESFKEEFKDYNIEFYLGSEIYYYEKMLDDLDNNKLLTLNNTKYVLLEFSTLIETDIKGIVYDTFIRGYNPIIAHIERYTYLKLEDYYEIKGQGALIQVNAHSFMNKAYKKQLKYLLKNNLIDFISSDCHNKHRDIDFVEAKVLISKKYPEQYERLFNEVPEYLK